MLIENGDNPTVEIPLYSFVTFHAIGSSDSECSIETPQVRQGIYTKSFEDGTAFILGESGTKYIGRVGDMDRVPDENLFGSTWIFVAHIRASHQLLSEGDR